MNELAFADSARPTPVVCLRLPLLPYSIGHDALLLSIRSPFLFTGFDELTWHQQISVLKQAVLICNRTGGSDLPSPKCI